MTSIYERNTTAQKDIKLGRISEVVFLRPGIAEFPIFKDLPVLAGFSWGEGSLNMAEKWEPSNPLAARKRTRDFLLSAGMSVPPQTALLIPTPNGEVIEFIKGSKNSGSKNGSSQDLEEELLFHASFLATEDPTISLAVKAADCPCAIVYAQKEDRKVVGLGHWGRDELEKKHPQAAMQQLIDEGYPADSMRVGISPSILPENYYIQLEDVSRLLPNLASWRNRAYNNGAQLHLDLVGYLIDQLHDLGIKEIEYYNVDTYESAQKKEGFSHRFATVTNQPAKNGRFIVAAQLQKPSA